jgi:ribosomal-protein-alanine N-acetyltransferase
MENKLYIVNVEAAIYKGKVIGSIGLHIDRKRNNDNVRMLGYVLSEDYWGKGLMTEAAREVIRYAFEDMGLDLISVYHYPSNIRSKRVIEKCGFQYEGTLKRASVIFNGNIYDDVCYSLTREDYRKKVKENSTG